MRLDVDESTFEFGIEKEFSIVGHRGGRFGYVLCARKLVERVLSDGLPGRARAVRDRLIARGWRIIPEYSDCLIEIISPPYAAHRLRDFLRDFRSMESILASVNVARGLERPRAFRSVALTDRHSLFSDQFFDEVGRLVVDSERIHLDAPLTFGGNLEELPGVFAGSESLALLYAGFASTNLTFHLPAGQAAHLRNDGALARFTLKVLSLAMDADRAERAPDGRIFFRDGCVPQISAAGSVRDDFLAWADAVGTTHRDKVLGAHPSGLSREALVCKNAGAGVDPYTLKLKEFGTTLLFEIRCLHSSFPVARMPALLDAIRRTADGVPRDFI